MQGLLWVSRRKGIAHLMADTKEKQISSHKQMLGKFSGKMNTTDTAYTQTCITCAKYLPLGTC